MSLLSRVEMLCDEADRESESIADGGKDSRNQISIEKPVPQLNLGAQRYHISGLAIHFVLQSTEVLTLVP